MHGQILTFPPPHLLMHPHITFFLLQLQAKLHTLSPLEIGLTSLICVWRGKFRRMAPGRNFFFPQTAATAPLKTPAAASTATVRTCHHEPGPHAGLLHRNDSSAHPFCLAFITLDRISMGLVKKRLTTRGILSTGRAQHRERAGRKTRTGTGNKPPDFISPCCPASWGGMALC